MALKLKYLVVVAHRTAQLDVGSAYLRSVNFRSFAAFLRSASVSVKFWEKNGGVCKRVSKEPDR